MKFFDMLFPIGRSNRGRDESPCSQAEALVLMDQYDISEALVYHTVARDNNPELGNAVLSDAISDSRLHKIWAYEFSDVKEQATPEDFLRAALKDNVKAIMVNPLIRDIRITRNQRILNLAKLLEQRRIPLMLTYRQWDGEQQDVIDWYELADFCNTFPKLPIISWEWRSRANRPMFDAMQEAKNLIVSLASIWQAQMTELIVNNFGADRLIFSMGLPRLDPGTFQAMVGYADISEAYKESIAAGNIKGILGGADYEQ